MCLFHVSPHYTVISEAKPSYFVAPILHTRKLRLRGIKEHAQGFPASKSGMKAGQPGCGGCVLDLLSLRPPFTRVTHLMGLLLMGPSQGDTCCHFVGQGLRSDIHQVTQLFRGRTGFTQGGLVSALLFPAL